MQCGAQSGSPQLHGSFNSHLNWCVNIYFPYTPTHTPSHPHRVQVTAFNGVVFGDSSTAVGTTQPIGNHSNQIIQLHVMKLQHACIHYTYIFITTLGGSNIRCVLLQQCYAHTHTHTHTHTQVPPVVSQLLQRPQTSPTPPSLSAGSFQEGTWTSTTSSTN